MRLGCAAGLSGLLALLSSAALADANVKDIRIARHADHVRVVLDLDGPVSFTGEGANGFLIDGLSSGSAVMNATARDAPLSRVVLSSEGNKTKLSFDTVAPVKAQAFTIAPDASGNHRLVVDLYVKARSTNEAAASPTLSPASASSPSIEEAAATPIMPAPATSPAQAAGPAVAAVAQGAVPTAAGTSVTPPPPMTAEAPPPAPPEAMPVPHEQQAANAPPASLLASKPAPPATPSKPTTIAPPQTQAPMSVSSTNHEPPQPLIAPVQVQALVPTPGEDRALFAERALDRGEAASACRMADEALRANPRDLRALAVLGTCRLALGDALAARAAFATALEGDPSYHRARLGLAQAEAKLGNIANAKASYARVLADNPPTDEAYKIIGAMEALGTGRVAGEPRHGS